MIMVDSTKGQKKFKDLKLAVVGHVEWMTFIEVDNLPKAGIITHSIRHKEEPAGGGAVSAIKMSTLINKEVHFFTALGNDSLGRESYSKLNEHNLKLHVAWKDQPTRKGISFIDKKKERSITVMGNRLQPNAEDDLPWQILKSFDGIFITATNAKGLQLCRAAKTVVATPRVKIQEIQKANIELDALISSALDPDEQVPMKQLKKKPKLVILTKGSDGGESFPGGKYKAFHAPSPLVDSYGCGDSFAAGVTTGIAAGLGIKEAIKLGAKCGAICSTHFGPYL